MSRKPPKVTPVNTPIPGKRERLTLAAANLFHQHGYARTSIGDVAAQADVPIGNVYYYFRTKEELAAAVTTLWVARIETILAELDRQPAVRDRLRSYLDRAAGHAAAYTEHGCPLASLSRDLRLEEVPGAEPLYALPLAWLERQFAALGAAKAKARVQARSFLARLQGAILLAHAQNNADIIASEIKLLRRELG